MAPPASPGRAASSVCVARATQANCASPVSILTDKLDDVFIFFSFPEVQPDFELSFENSPSTETLDYVLLDGFTEDLKEVIKTKTIMIFIAFLTVHCLFLDVL